jgi:hypothetical protein
VPTYQPLGQSRDDVRHESCHSTYRQRTMPRPDHKGAKQGFAILDLAETLVKLPRLDSNQQPFGLSDLLCGSDR